MIAYEYFGYFNQYLSDTVRSTGMRLVDAWKRLKACSAFARKWEMLELNDRAEWLRRQLDAHRAHNAFVGEVERRNTGYEVQAGEAMAGMI